MFSFSLLNFLPRSTRVQSSCHLLWMVSRRLIFMFLLLPLRIYVLCYFETGVDNY